MYIVLPCINSFLLVLSVGLSSIILNPTNQTTCVGAPAVFHCVISDQRTIIWFVNGIDIIFLGLPDPITTRLPNATGSESVLELPGISLFAGASVVCNYDQNYSPPAFLTVYRGKENMQTFL